MQHGDFDSQQQKWFCGFWMSQEEWLDVHDYAPPMLRQEEEDDNEAVENEDEE